MARLSRLMEGVFQMPDATRPSDSRKLSATEAAEYLDLSIYTVNGDRYSGALGIPFERHGRRIEYDTAALDRWKASRPPRRCRRPSPAISGVRAEA